MHDLDLTVNMLGLCDPSNLLFVLSARSDALFSNYFEDLLSVASATTAVTPSRRLLPRPISASDA